MPADAPRWTTASIGLPEAPDGRANFERYFWGNAQIASAEECWHWVGNIKKSGYGIAHIKKRRVLAHRVSYLLYYGTLPPNMYVCHRCDVPACVNPHHLFLGSPQENKDDCVRKNRQARQFGVENGRAIIDDEIASRIKASIRSGAPLRVISSRENVSIHIVKEISRGRSWKTVGGLHVR